MSGVGEASLMLGLVSSTIAVFELAQEIYEAASDAKGLPKKFRVAAEQIPLVIHALSLAEKNINTRNVNEKALQSAKPILERCNESAAAVKDIFDKTIPAKDATRADRLIKAVGIKRKGKKVKEHMEEIYRSIELLAQYQVFQDAEALQDIKGAIEQLINLPDEEEQPHFVHSGAGVINASTGGATQENYNNSGAGSQLEAEKQYLRQIQAHDHRQMRVSDDHNVTYNSHMASMASQPSAVLPFRRDRDFIDRPLLDDIVQRASEPGTRVGLVGLGGVGKSQLAIEYAYRVRDLNPDRWVFWVHASSVARFEGSYRDIAARLQLSGWNESKADVLEMVHRWLSDNNNAQWTVVVDNADDSTILFEPYDEGTGMATATTSTGKTLSDYLPLSGHGSIVITSRSREVVERLQVFTDDILDVKPMESDVAKRLLLVKLKKGRRDAEAGDIERLVKYLDHMPLAITQAAAYIEQGAPRMTVPRYIEMLEKNDGELTNLLQKDVRDQRRDRQASNSIIMTWHVTFTHLRQKHASAARLLALMSLFDREAIPDYLLQGRYTEAAEGPTDLEDDIITLRAYSLVSTGVSDDLLEMHRLVQLSTQKWLEIHAELQSWQERYIDILCGAFPDADYANWTRCQALFPHVEAMTKYRVVRADYLEQWAMVMRNGARYVMARGQYGIAEQMARASLEAYEEILDVSYVSVLGSEETLATALFHQGNYDQVEEMERRTLAWSKKILGVDHPSTLTLINNLGTTLKYQGKYEQAEEMARETLVRKQAVLGVDCLETLISLDNLASTLQVQGKYKEAEEMSRRALAGIEKVLGLDHPDTLVSVAGLAFMLQHQGKYEEAEEMNRRALAGREKVLGVDHPDTLMIISNLASTLDDQGKYEQAEEMNRRALVGSEKVLDDQGKYEQAEEMNRRALVGREKVLGVDHPDTLTGVDNLASTLQNQGKYEHAEEMNRRALAGREEVLGMDHPDTLISVSNLASTLRCQGKYEQAEEMNRRALAGREEVLGVDHPKTLGSVYCLAYLLSQVHDHDQALDLYDRAITGYQKVLGPEHPDTIACQEHRAALMEEIE